MLPQKVRPIEFTRLTPQIPAHLLHNGPHLIFDDLGDAGEGVAALAHAGGFVYVEADGAGDLEDGVGGGYCAVF